MRRDFLIKPADISRFQFIIEGYEGLATVTTIDAKKARIAVFIMPDFSKDIAEIIEFLQDEMGLVPVSDKEEGVL